MTRRKWRLLLLIFGLPILPLFWYLDRHPWLLPGIPFEAERVGELPDLRDHGDVLLILGPSAPIASSSLEALEPSHAWSNLLEAEFGAYSLMRTGTGSSLGSQPCRIVSSSAHEQIDLAELELFVYKGGVVFFDAPCTSEGWSADLLALAGLELKGELPFPRDNLLPDFTLDAVDRDAFSRAPFPRPESAFLLAPTAADTRPLNGSTPPLFFERRWGAGKLITAAFSVARLSLTMLQGIPGRDFSLKERHGDYPDILEPDDLVLDPKLRENETPFADLLARAVAALLDPPDPARPGLPRLLWYPRDSAGLFLMTHDEDFRGGEELLQLMEQDHQLGLLPTVFVIAHPRLLEDWSRDDGRQVARLGGALGLHWNRFPMPRGLGPVEPVQLVQSLESQLNRLLPIGDPSLGIRTNRNHYLILQDGWTRTFRKLAAAGIRLDSTFGANKGRGYLFGTARPYRILDQNGLPLALRELPFVHQEDWGGADQQYFTRLLEANAARHRGALVSLFHSHLVVRETAGRQLYEHAARTALATGHRPMNFDQLLEFWEARDRARIRSERTPDEWICSIEVERDDFQLALPGASAALLSRARLDDHPLVSSRTRLGGRDCTLIPLPSGLHELKIPLR